jgi:plastocyanin
MRKLRTVALPTLLVVVGVAVLGLAGCDTASPTPNPQNDTLGNEVDMTQVDFTRHAVTIPAGTDVRFSNPAAGITHVLCIGANATCTPDATAPAELTARDGLILAAGQLQDVTFDTPGTYKIACMLHPGMNLTVTVE